MPRVTAPTVPFKPTHFGRFCCSSWCLRLHQRRIHTDRWRSGRHRVFLAAHTQPGGIVDHIPRGVALDKRDQGAIGALSPSVGGAQIGIIDGYPGGAVQSGVGEGRGANQCSGNGQRDSRLFMTKLLGLCCMYTTKRCSQIIEEIYTHSEAEMQLIFSKKTKFSFVLFQQIVVFV